jgi:molybdate transport system ATP-binding protein
MLTARVVKRRSPAFTLDVDVVVNGGVTILFGPSGSGKSTILRCIAGLTRPDAGHITVDGAVLFDTARGVDVPPQRRGVGMVFQQLALFPHMTVARNIGYGLNGLPRDERERRVTAIARTFHVDQFLARRPGLLSGGERQRVALARALVTEPRALLLDEPLTALDYDTQSRIIDDLRRWNAARRIPVLYVTHAHREVYALGEQVIVVENGRVADAGLPHAVLEHPANARIAQLAGFENLLAGRVVRRDGAAGTMHVALDGSTLELEVPLADTPTASPVTVAIRAGDIMVATEPPGSLSAQNLIEAELADCRREGPAIVAGMTAGGATRIIVHLTPRACDRLGLRVGCRVWLVIKTYSCRIAAK